MQGTHDIDDNVTADDNNRLDPREAARLLTEAQRSARRQFELRPPWITAVMGSMILGA
jgi:hypothetical protein